MKTLYEVNWHYDNGTLVRISVSPIKVLREGILPGCSAVSITAVAKDGHQFQGCPQYYFETEEAAWKQATIELQEAIASEQRGICKAQRRIEGLRSVLSAIQGDEPAEVPQDAISVVGMPEFDALMDYIYEEGTSGEAVIRLTNKLVRVAIQSHITRARNAQSERVTEGWQLVPVEPTPEMAKVSTWDMNSFYPASKVWADMLAVAPPQPAAQEVEN